MANEEQFKQLMTTNEEFRNRFSGLDDTQKRDFITKFTGGQQEKQGFSERVLSAGPKTEQLIEERGDAPIVQPAKTLITGDGSRVQAALKLISSPFQRVEAAIANPLITAQNGDFSKVPESFIQGITGQRVGEFGDVYRNVGVPDKVAATLGFGTDMVFSGGLIEHGIRTLRKGIVKFGDRAAVKGVTQILDGVDKAEKANRAATNAFWGTIDKTTTDVAQLVDDVSKLPKNAVKIIESEIGKNIETIKDLGDVRKVKQTLGFIKSNAFGKAERGLSSTLDEIKVNEAYSGISRLIKKSLVDSGLSKQADELIRVNDRAEEIINSGKMIKRNLMKSTKEKKVVNAVKKLTDLDGADFRIKLDSLSKESKKASKIIRNASADIRGIAAKQARKTFLNRAAVAVGISGIAGTVGGSIARRSLRDNGDNF